MNIFKFELKSQIINAAIWTVGIISIMVIFQSGIYPIFLKSVDDIMEMLNGFPKPLLSAFGFDSEFMFSFGGFFNLTFSYLSLMGAIMATVLSITILSHEKRSKCLDFLLVKPYSRMKIFWSKLFCVLTLVLISNLLLILVSVFVYSKTVDLKKLIISLLGLMFTEIVFVALGTVFSVFAKRIRSVSGIATAFGFGAFTLSAMYGILNEEKLRYITPLKYFNPYAVYLNGGFETKYVITAAIITVVCISTACYRFCKCDAHSV